MKRTLLLILLLTCVAAPIRAQNTTVTATVTDPNSIPYAFSTGYAALVCPGNQAPTFNGFSVPRSFPITGFDGTGSFTQNLYDVSVLVPTGCGYQFHITYKDGVTTFTTGLITSVTGSSVNLSSAISAYAVLLPTQPTNTPPGGASGTLQYNNSGTFGGALGSAVAPATGAITLTSQGTTDTPFSVATTFSAQTKPIVDFNVNSSTAGLGTINFRGYGTGNWSAAGGHILLHLMADAPAGQAPVGWMVSNNRSGYLGSGAPSGAMAAFCGDTGLCSLSSGGASDANGNYSGIVFEASPSISAGRGVVVFNSDNANPILADFTVANSTNIHPHDTQIWQNGCTAGFTTCVTVSGVDTNGNFYGPSYKAVDAATNGFGGLLTSALNPCETAYAATTVNNVSATTTTGQTCVPANSMIVDVTYRITTTVTTAASFTVGISGSTSKFCSTQSTLTAGTTGHCNLQVNAGTMESGASAVAVVVTFNTTPGAGAIRIEVAAIGATPPTS